MKITIYELLGLIKNGKAPKRIKDDEYIYTLREQFNDYWNEESYLLVNGFDDYENTIDFLNSKVEILEEVEDKEYEDITEMKIEYDDGDMGIDGKYLLTNHSEIYADKINALIRNQKYILEQLKNK